MFISELISKKKRGQILSKIEIQNIIKDYSEDKIPEYQMASLLMAIWFTGLDDRELFDWTTAMKNSGEIIDLKKIVGVKADKHSTGGVADTTSLVALPLAVSCGCKVAKMSGRGLGHTGGTLDKLESIPGMKIDLDTEQFFNNVGSVGLSIIGQTKNIVLADKKLYALRDVTETVDSIPLIASSIMSKKLASGSDVIVLDVKVGNGAFMTDLKDAKVLAKKMVNIGKMEGKKVCAILSGMDQPLGNCVGNSLEVMEAIEILKGKCEGDLKNLSIVIAAKMVELSGITKSYKEAKQMVEYNLRSGKGLEVFRNFLQAQSGDFNVVDNYSLFPPVKEILKIRSEKFGYVNYIDTKKIGKVAMLLGAGRERLEDKIDFAVGIKMLKRLNSLVCKEDDVLAEFCINDKKNLQEAINIFYSSIKIGKRKCRQNRLIYKVMD